MAHTSSFPLRVDRLLLEAFRMKLWLFKEINTCRVVLPNDALALLALVMYVLVQLLCLLGVILS